MAEVLPKLGRDIALEVKILKYEMVDNAPDASGLAKGLEALKARVSLAKSGQHVEYLLQVRRDGSTWTLRRRFQQVSLMHESLRRHVASLPELPAKSVVRQFSSDYLESRKNALAAYLLAERRDVLNAAAAQDFFGLLEREPSLQMRSRCDPFLAAEVQEVTFGITSFVTDPSRGLLLLGASDCNWVSKLDTKITNIKLPWEPSAPELPSSQMTLWKELAPGSQSYQVQFCCRFGPALSSVALVKGDGACALCGLSDGSVGVQKLSAPGGVSRGATLPLLKHTAAVSALAVDEKERWLFSASKDNAVKVYDLVRRGAAFLRGFAGQQMVQCETHAPTPVTTMLFDEAQRRLFTGLQSGVIIVWDTSILPLKVMCSIPDTTQALSRITGMDYEAGSGTLFSSGKDMLGVWKLKSASSGSWGRSVGSISAQNVCTGVAWAASSRELLVSLATGAIVAFALADGTAGPSYSWQAHEDEITHMQWDDAQRCLITASKDKKLRIWHFFAPGRPEPSPIATAVISTAPSLLPARRGAASQMEGVPVRQTPTVSPPSATPSYSYPASHGPVTVPVAAPVAAPGCQGDDSEDDLTGWDR
ncbi:unnamed protein product [Effrenium voratum]|uniref:PX domain-containing protein n=1 Tax=Effrenium voratum TaxID=2562239 RepID=A0AA36JDX0_9DINO|nr:unnamed protein product [Effrenium voratum]